MLLKYTSLDYGVGFLVLALERNLRICFRTKFLYFPRVVGLCSTNAKCALCKMLVDKWHLKNLRYGIL